MQVLRLQREFLVLGGRAPFPDVEKPFTGKATPPAEFLMRPPGYPSILAVYQTTGPLWRLQ